jgi:hypothetical protein
MMIMQKKSLIDRLSDPIPGPKATTNHIPLNKKSTSMSFLGLSEKEYNLPTFHRHSNKPSLLSRISLETSSLPNHHLLTHSSALNSQTRNGQISSMDEQLTSTTSCPDYSPYPKSKDIRRKSASLKSPLARRHQRSLLECMESGLQHGILPSRQQCLSSLIVSPNSNDMGNIYSSFSPLSHLSLTTESSALTGQPESELPNAVTCSSLISGNSLTSTCTGYKTQVVQPLEPWVVALNKESVAPKNVKHVDDGMKANVATQLLPAAMPMSA